MSVEKKGKTVYVNPGSLTGAFSSSNPFRQCGVFIP